ncbi:MFS transporter [Pseudomonas yamanorum]|uniref:MFS transporter n=1 Tax=Pseudomonas yamanorum TaxID=515393 RepID=UPI001C45229E|nr:MFS transporter [Pseudomonas yamanorum]MBV6659761.1 MFS transporter [Pseudomonas yamanorum]
MSAVSTVLSTLRPELRGAAVLRLALAYSLATAGLTLTPFLVASVMLRFQLDESVATQIAGVEILGIAVSCALLPRWIARTAGVFTLIGTMGIIVGQCLSAWAPTLMGICSARGLTGLCEGALFVVVGSGISQRIGADRLWGKINLIAGVINGSVLVMISALPESWLSRWLFFMLMGVATLIAPWITTIGAFTHRVVQVSKSAKPPTKLVLSVWVCTVLIYGVQASQWAVSTIVGTHAGLSPVTTGMLLSVSSLVGFAGAIVPSIRCCHNHRVGIIWFSQLVLAGSILWFFLVTGDWSFFLSQVILNVSFFVIIPFLSGVLSEVDPDGSLIARTVVITFVGAGLGTAVAGELLVQLGAFHFACVLGLGIALTVPFVWIALRRPHTEHSYVTASSR